MSAFELPALCGGPPLRPQGPPDWPGPDPEVREAALRAWADGSWGKYNGVYGTVVFVMIRPQAVRDCVDPPGLV